MTPEQAQALREKFAPEAIGKLPKLTCSDCSRRSCSRHEKRRCPECGNYLSTAHVHLDYVGHAATTDRLLKVDPEWTWEPFAVDANGLPALDPSGNLWIRLTVAGVTRIGVGDGSSMKERIGDAIRNAAMRFGVALDLWAKEDLAAGHDETPEPQRPQRSQPRAEQPPAGVDPETGEITPADAAAEPIVTTHHHRKLNAIARELGMDDSDRQTFCIEWVQQHFGRTIRSRSQMTAREADSVIAELEARLNNSKAS